jgi:hypothetical protein
MTVREWYEEALISKFYSLRLLIEFLVYEKKVIKFEDDEAKLKYYLQDRFAKKMNEYLSVYEVKRNEQIRTANHETSNRHVG